jgi:hypothetical protein
MAASPRQRVLALCRQVQSASKRTHLTETVQIATHDAYVINLFARTIGLFDAIVLLLKHGLSVEAMALARPLFTDSLRLAELAEAGDERREIILGEMNQGIQERIDLLREAERLGIEENAARQIQTQEDQRKSLLRYQERHGVGKLKRFTTEKNMTHRCGRQEEYWAYRLSHHMVHGSDVALTYRRRPLEKGYLACSVRDMDEMSSIGFGAFAAKSMLLSARAVARIFACQEPEEFGPLLESADSLLSEDALPDAET